MNKRECVPSEAARRVCRAICLLALALGTVGRLYAADDQDRDSYRLRIDAFWFYANPSGSFTGSAGNGRFDFHQDFGLTAYSTFTGKIDWKFTRKNHLMFSAIPFTRSRQFVLSRTVTFEGQTFDAGLAASGSLYVLGLAPGYQYDIIRRGRGHLGIVAQLDLFDVNGTLSSAAQVSNGVLRVAQTSNGSLRAPIPVAGPDVRYYLLSDSDRLYVTGNVLGMYLFGYGNFISTTGSFGVSLTNHLGLRAGYQLASRLDVNTKSSRVGLSLTQQGAVAGVEFSF